MFVSTEMAKLDNINNFFLKHNILYHENVSLVFKLTIVFEFNDLLMRQRARIIVKFVPTGLKDF